MTKNQRPVIVAIFALGSLVGCSSNKGVGNTPGAGMGGLGSSAGGAIGATGGVATGGSSGIVAGSGGVNGTGGAIAATGGRATGGSGGGAPGSGGVNNTGGAIAATGGGPRNTGGTQNGAGGGSVAKPTGGSGPAAGGALGTGGAPGTGGTNLATGGRSATGGALSTGGAPGTGGTNLATGGRPATGGAGTGGATAVDPNVAAAINACISKLPYGGSTLSTAQRAPIITAIVNACAQFAPPGAQWQTWCQMFLAAAINRESSYDTQAGATGASGDPSVGLLQIRFTSIVLDFANYGPIDALTRAGCNFGTVTSSDTYATKGSMMLDVNCNVAIGAWYYFIFASGNGGSTVVWVDQYCSGGGVAGNLHIGMASFLMGGDAAHSSLSGADYYVNDIKSWFDPCVTYTGTHPFELAIQPDTSKYCK